MKLLCFLCALTHLTIPTTKCKITGISLALKMMHRDIQVSETGNMPL